MANGANRLFNVMKETSESTNTVPSQIVSLKVKSIQPLIFTRDDRLEIIEDFCIFSKLIRKEDIKVNDVVTAIVLNDGQNYYIEHNNDDDLVVVSKKELEKVEKQIEAHYTPNTTSSGEYGWYLALSGEISEDWDNHTFILSIDQIFNGQAGQLYVNIRRDNGETPYIYSFKWLSNTGIPSEYVVLKITGNSYYLYLYTEWEYKQYQIKVIEQSSLEGKNEDILFFYTVSSAEAESVEPTGTNPTMSSPLNAQTDKDWRIKSGVYHYEQASTTTYDLPYNNVIILTMLREGTGTAKRGVALAMRWADSEYHLWINRLHNDYGQYNWQGWVQLY